MGGGDVALVVRVSISVDLPPRPAVALPLSPLVHPKHHPTRCDSHTRKCPCSAPSLSVLYPRAKPQAENLVRCSSSRMPAKRASGRGGRRKRACQGRDVDVDVDAGMLLQLC